MIRALCQILVRITLVSLVLGLSACSAPQAGPDAASGADPESGERRTLNFGIIATESSSNLESNWRPFIAAMEEWTGYDVEPFYASDYAGMIQAMRYGSIQVAWFSNFSGLQAVRLGGGQVFAKATYPDGSEGYNSVLIVPVDSPIQSVEDVLSCDRSIDFGMGDPNSTSGYLVPSAFIFAPRGIDPGECFNSVRNANHEANALAVANGLVDVATNNTTNMTLLARTRPDIASRIRVVDLAGDPDRPDHLACGPGRGSQAAPAILLHELRPHGHAGRDRRCPRRAEPALFRSLPAVLERPPRSHRPAGDRARPDRGTE